jgi:toxin CcdB
VAQFHAYANGDTASSARVPYLLEVQSDLLSSLDTSIVAPLCLAERFRGRIVSDLMPIVVVGDQEYVMLTTELTGIARRDLGPEVQYLWASRQAIIAALKLALLGF